MLKPKPNSRPLLILLTRNDVQSHWKKHRPKSETIKAFNRFWLEAAFFKQRSDLN